MSMLSLHKGDITELAVDAVVNAANPSLLGGGGVDGAIHAAGGPAILQACRAVVERDGPCQPGQAVVTTAGELEAAMVIHTVGPRWDEANAQAHSETLASCYYSALRLAHAHHAKTVAFPSISTGAYSYPPLPAAITAVNAVLDWLEEHPDHNLVEIFFVCYDDQNYKIYESIIL